MQTTKYYKLRIGSEIGILLEFFLNAFKCLTVSISTEIVILAIAPLLFISVGIFFAVGNLLYCQMCTF